MIDFNRDEVEKAATDLTNLMNEVGGIAERMNPAKFPLLPDLIVEGSRPTGHASYAFSAYEAAVAAVKFAEDRLQKTRRHLLQVLDGDQ